MGYKDWSLEKRFAVLSFVTFLILGALMVSGNMWFIKEQLLASAGKYAESWAHSLVRYQFWDNDFKDGLNQERYQQIDGFFRNNVLNGDIKRVKVWNYEGKVIYSDESSIIGRTFKKENDLVEALEGEVHAGYEEMNDEEKATEKQFGDKMIEVYVPIYSIDKQSVIGVFELYISDHVLFEQLQQNYKLIILTVIGGLSVLYLILIGIVKKASSTILAQDTEIKQLYSNLDDSLEWQVKSQVGTIKALLSTLNAKDNYTAGHSLRVADYATRLGKSFGLTDHQLKILDEAAIFHDIGKIGVPEVILNKPTNFTVEEYDIIKKHPSIGSDIVGSIHYLREHAKIIRHHHERIDGTGYPDQLKGDEISLEAKILAIADTYDALTSDRQYRKGVTKEKALEIMGNLKETQLDGNLTELFASILN